MHALVVGREITSGGGGESSLSIDSHAGSETVAIAARPVKRDHQPVLLAASIEQNLRTIPKRRHYHILPAVVVQIAERCAARRCKRRGARGGSPEPATVI